MTKTNLDLSKDSILKLFLNFFTPMLLAMLAMASYSTVDGVFVNKKLGDDAMKAIVAVWPIFPAVMACSLTFGLGSASLIGYYLAKGKKHIARAIFSSVIYFMLPLTMLIGALLYINSEFVLQFLVKDLSPHAKVMAIDYLEGIALGISAIMLHPILDICVINDKRPQFAMSAMFLGAILNVIFNYLFLFVFELGIAGSAYATVLGHAVGSLVLMWHYIPTRFRILFLKRLALGFLVSRILYKKGDLCFISVFNIALIPRVMKLGLPYGASEVSVGVVMWLYNQTLKGIGGEDALAIYSSVLYAGFNFFTVLLALAESIQPLASFNYGMRDKKRLADILRFYIKVELCISLIIYAAFFIFDEYIAMMFLKDASLKAQSAEAIRIYFFGFIFLGINLIVAMYLQSLQRAFASFVVTISYTFIFIAILLPIVSSFYGLIGAYIAYPLSQICALCVSIAVLWWVKRSRSYRELGEMKSEKRYL